jgi:tol-pal system protein YbgF
MRRALLLAVIVGLAGPALAQDRTQTLADIRQDLTQLNAEIQGLRRELSTTGNSGLDVSGSGITGRLDAIEAELSRLTSQTEALQNRVDRVVTDGTNRIGDLEFRLVELEGGDLGALGTTSTLGGGELPQTAAPATPAAPATGGPQLAVSEEADFRRAKDAYDAGDYAQSVTLFQTFTDTYLGGPLTGVAHFLRGEALTKLGQDTAAARAYLESFSGSPQSDVAPAALLQLGLSLNRLGQLSEACVTLGEVTARFPASPASIEAQAARANLGCV